MLFDCRTTPPPSATLTWLGQVGYPPVAPSSTAHDHPWHELVLVREGTYCVDIGNRRIECQPGEGIYYRAGVSHKPMPVRRTCLLTVIQWHGMPAPIEDWAEFRDYDLEIATLCDWLLRRYPPESEPARYHVDALFTSVLMALGDSERAPINLADDLAHYIRNALHQETSMAELVRVTGLSERHISRVFTERFGETPTRYRRRTMVKRAIHLLLSSRLNIDTVATAAGFRNAQALTRAVRAAHALTPTQIRQNGGLTNAHQDSPIAD